MNRSIRLKHDRIHYIHCIGSDYHHQILWLHYDATKDQRYRHGNEPDCASDDATNRYQRNYMANLRYIDNRYYTLPSLDSITNWIHPMGLLLHTNGNIHSNSPRCYGIKQPSGQDEYDYKTTVPSVAKVIRQGCQNEEKDSDRGIFVSAKRINLIT